MSLVRFSPDEQFLAVVAGGGTVVMWGLHLSGSGVSKVGGRERGSKGGREVSPVCFTAAASSCVQSVEGVCDK